MGLLILIFFYQAFSGIRGWNEAGDDISVLQQQVDGVRSILALQTSLVDEALEQIEVLEGERDAATADLRQLGESRRDWESALSTLFGINVEGVSLALVDTRQIGDIRVQGTATTVTVMEEYRSRLRGVEEDLVLRSFNWSITQTVNDEGDPVSRVNFTMELVLQEASGAA